MSKRYVNTSFCSEDDSTSNQSLRFFAGNFALIAVSLRNYSQGYTVRECAPQIPLRCHIDGIRIPAKNSSIIWNPASREHHYGLRCEDLSWHDKLERYIYTQASVSRSCTSIYMYTVVWKNIHPNKHVIIVICQCRGHIECVRRNTK